MIDWQIEFNGISTSLGLFYALCLHNTPTASLLRCKTPRHDYPQLYDTKQSDCEDTAISALWGMQSTLSLPSFPGSLWPGVVAPDRIISMSQIGLNCVLKLNWIVWYWTVWSSNCE